MQNIFIHESEVDKVGKRKWEIWVGYSIRRNKRKYDSLLGYKITN